MTLLDELFERPDTKVVVFSQWLRMHELLVRRFKGKKLGPRFLSRRRAERRSGETWSIASARIRIAGCSCPRTRAAWG